jgi:hypothetical protein
MMQDQRMRDTGFGGDILQPQPLWPAARDERLRRVEDQLARFFRRAAKAFRGRRRF